MIIFFMGVIAMLSIAITVFGIELIHLRKRVRKLEEDAFNKWFKDEAEKLRQLFTTDFTPKTCAVTKTNVKLAKKEKK